jgi:hypothetical protein
VLDPNEVNFVEEEEDDDDLFAAFGVVNELI